MVENTPDYLRSPPRRRPIFSAARDTTYARFVGWMKIILPVSALILLVLVLTWPKLILKQGTEVPSLPRTTNENTDDARAHHLSISGFDKHDQPFTITARQAIQDDPGGDTVVLDTPSADITLKEGTWLAAKAESGHLNRKTELLQLSGSVDLFHDQGFELRMEAASVDLRNGVAWSDTPVEGSGPQGELHAEGLEVLDRGERVIFTGRSRVVFYRGGS